jgi:allene oxide cyclase
MSRRVVLAIGTSVVLAVAAGSTALAGPMTGRAAGKLVQPGGNEEVRIVVERALTDSVVDLKPTGDSLGDLLAFGNPIYDPSNTEHIGRDEGSCVRVKVGKAWECSWTTILPKGHITVQGPFYDDGRDSLLSITGGTGIYRSIRGEMELHWRNALGTEFDFIFSFTK